MLEPQRLALCRLVDAAWQRPADSIDKAMPSRERLIDFVPQLYAHILPDPFQRPIAEERNATCEQCAMCRPEPAWLDEAAYYSPKVKCCTYHPVLPNFLVGGLLASPDAADAEGRRRVRAKIARRAGVTPVGIHPDARSRLLYRHGAEAGFGRAEALACPYLDSETGRCTVWSHRDAVCATWFCKYNAGKDGMEFWHQLRDTLLGAQRLLVFHVLSQLGWTATEILDDLSSPAPLDASALDGGPPDGTRYAALWRQWAGREEAFFTRCHQLVRELDRAGFERLGGLPFALELERLGQRHEAAQDPRLPDPLQKNPMMRIERAADGSYLLTAYIGTDISRLRAPVYALLDRFDGRTPTATVQATMRAETGTTLSDALVRKLYQHRILVAPRKPNPTAGAELDGPGPTRR